MWQTLNSTFLTNTPPPPPRPLKQSLPVNWGFHSQTHPPPPPPHFPCWEGLPCMMCIIYAGQDMTQDTAVRLECLLLFSFFFLFGNCVKVSVALTMSLSFRSNVNYIPPPQEVSFFFNFPPSTSSSSYFGHLSNALPKHNQVVFFLNISAFVVQPQDFKHTQSFMLWEAGLPLRTRRPRGTQGAKLLDSSLDSTNELSIFQFMLTSIFCLHQKTKRLLLLFLVLLC